MVAAHLVLINHFFVSLTHNSPDLAIPDVNSVLVDLGCPLGCTQCSAVNGCLACKPPFFLLLHREGTRQTASCTRACPRGFYKLKKKRNGFCAKCTMRGCSECLGIHYCSSCNPHYVNFFGKCITQPPDNELEELGGIFVTRPPLEFPTSPAAVTAVGVGNTSSSPSIATPILIFQASTTRPSNSTSPSNSTTPIFASPMTTPAGWGSEIAHNASVVPSAAPPSSTDGSPEGSYDTSTPSYDHDSRPCRRKPRRRKEGRRRIKERKNRKGDNGGRRTNGRRGNREKGRRIAGREGNTQGRINHKTRRRGCRRRKKTEHRILDSRGTQQLLPVNSTTRHNNSEREGKISLNLSPADESQPTGGQSTKKMHKHSEKYDLNRNRESVRLSLLTGTKKLDNRSTHIVNNKKFLYKNRPHAMVEFKQKKAHRLTKPPYANGHRVRHGRPNHQTKIKT